MKATRSKTKKPIIITVLVAFLAIVITAVVLIVIGLNSYWNIKCARFKRENANLEQGQIVFIGDSITDQFNLEEYFSLPLKTYNRGISGDTTDGILKRLSFSALDIAPSKLVILIGINDINNGKSATYVIDNYIKILDEIENALPDCEIYIQSIYPVLNKVFNIEKHTPSILQVNEALKNEAQRRGQTYIDVFSALKNQNDLLEASFTDDGLHLNAQGYSVVKATIEPFLV